MQGASLHSLLDVPGKPPRRRATCWLKLAEVYIYQHTGCECGRGEAEGHRGGLSGHQGATCTQWEIQTQLLKCQLKFPFLHLLLLKVLATPSVFPLHLIIGWKQRVITLFLSLYSLICLPSCVISQGSWNLCICFRLPARPAFAKSEFFFQPSESFIGRFMLSSAALLSLQHRLYKTPEEWQSVTAD